MTFLPIVARELRVTSRRRGTYWSRSFTAVAAILLSLFVYLEVRHEPPHDAGQSLFYVISGMAFVYCLATGIRSTADCLSEEKREGTLGLLFLTDLKGYDVVGGKLVATSLNAFYGLIAIFPVLAIPLLMGGITNGEFWRMALVLVNCFFFSLAVGMFMSSISKSPRKSMAATLVTVLFFTVGILLCQAWIPFIYRSPALMHAGNLLLPEYVFSLVNDLRYATLAKDYWWGIGITHGLGWVCLMAASFIVPRSWQDKPAGAGMVRWRDKWHRLSFGDAEARRAFRKRLLDINAFFWLAARSRLKPLHVWMTFAVLASVWIWGAVEYRRDWMNEAVYFITAIVLSTTLKIWVASEAGSRLGEDRKIGSLELLLSTPMSVADILRGQILALRRQFLLPMITVLVIETVFLFAAMRENEKDVEGMTLFVSIWVAYMIMLAADLPALSVVAMWVSLTTKNPNRTTGITLTRLLVLPTVIWVATMMLYTFFRYATSSQGPGWQLLLGLYFGLGMAADLFFGINAWRQLRANFREVAVQRFAQGPSIFRRLFGRRKPAAEIPPPLVIPS